MVVDGHRPPSLAGAAPSRCGGTGGRGAGCSSTPPGEQDGAWERACAPPDRLQILGRVGCAGPVAGATLTLCASSSSPACSGCSPYGPGRIRTRSGCSWSSAPSALRWSIASG